VAERRVGEVRDAVRAHAFRFRKLGLDEAVGLELELPQAAIAKAKLTVATAIDARKRERRHPRVNRQLESICNVGRDGAWHAAFAKKLLPGRVRTVRPRE
jgi:hypothetical protein